MRVNSWIWGRRDGYERVVLNLEDSGLRLGRAAEINEDGAIHVGDTNLLGESERLARFH